MLNFIGRDSLAEIKKALGPSLRKLEYSHSTGFGSFRKTGVESVGDLSLRDMQFFANLKKAVETRPGITDPTLPPQSPNSRYDNKTADNGGINPTTRLVDSSENPDGVRAPNANDSWLSTYAKIRSRGASSLMPT